jgi:hypothetical protein
VGVLVFCNHGWYLIPALHITCAPSGILDAPGTAQHAPALRVRQILKPMGCTWSYWHFEQDIYFLFEVGAASPRLPHLTSTRLSLVCELLQLRCLLKSPLRCTRGSRVRGHMRLAAHSRQSHDVSIELKGPPLAEGGPPQASTCEADLKEPYYRYNAMVAS